MQLNVSTRINQNKDRRINIAEYFFKFLIILKQFIKESNLKWLLELVKSKHIFIKKKHIIQKIKKEIYIVRFV